VSNIARAAIRGIRRSTAVYVFAVIGIFAVVAVVGVFLAGMVIIRKAAAATSFCIRRSPLTAGKGLNAAKTAVGVKAGGVTLLARHTGNSDHATGMPTPVSPT
jgi:hypothetical protein